MLSAAGEARSDGITHGTHTRISEPSAVCDKLNIVIRYTPRICDTGNSMDTLSANPLPPERTRTLQPMLFWLGVFNKVNADVDVLKGTMGTR